jgi:hypothetical protein
MKRAWLEILSALLLIAVAAALIYFLVTLVA